MSEKIKKTKPKLNITEGPILKTLIALAIPIIFANLLQTAYQLTDTFWVGKLGADAVAAVSVSFPIIFLLVSLGTGLSMAGTILVAQHMGRGDKEATDHVASQTLGIIFIISILLTIFGWIVAPHLVSLMGVSGVVATTAITYMKVTFIGIVFTFVYAVFESLMRGVGDVKIPMYIVAGTVLLNFVLDPLFMYGYGPIPALGAPGTAMATVSTQLLAAIIGVTLLFTGKRHIHVKIKDLKPDFKLIKKVFKLGIPSSIEMTIRSIGMILITFLIASFGTTAVASYGIGSRSLMLVIIPALGLSIATSTMIGQAIGAGKIKRAEQVAKTSAVTGFILLSIIGILFYIFAEKITEFFIAGDPQVTEAASLFIRYMSFTFGFLGILLVLNGAFRGAGNTFASMMLSMISIWIAQLPIAYYLSHYTPLAEHGIFVSFPISNIVMCIITVVWFMRGTWKKTKVIGDGKLTQKVGEEVIIEKGIQ